ncbi:MAG TPA: DUF4838 domain-containing protein [Sphingomonadaceae bacterium]|nr:DUF4838 domain-containing protein [Sphingomonadaceae bacterium]
MRLCSLFLLAIMLGSPGIAQRAGAPSPSDLVVAERGANGAVIVVAANAGPWEQKAAADLRKYIGLMTGTEPAVTPLLPASGVAIVVGRAATAVDRATAAALRRAAKKDPVVQADAISVRRHGDRVFVAGSNDESHYFAASWLLQQWGCRWYMPTEFGEVVPEHRRLTVGNLDFAYAPPFEIRRYWLSWNGDPSGRDEFQRRNFISGATMPGYGHALDHYTADLAPPGGSHFNVPFADPRTAEHVAAKLEADYAAGKNISIAVADGAYTNDHPADRALGGTYDPYFLKPSMTDAMMTLYNAVGRRLRVKYPESPARLGGMAYVNVTLPPTRVSAVEPNIVMWIAPIDIDPNHAMDDPRSPPRREYRRMVERWSTLLKGRLAVYDYDQGMLVWRDLPNPSHHVFARDAKIYRQAGILGIQTESRGALAATFLNLFLRGQLMWNPDADVPALLREFYPAFYGPAGDPMSRYWSRIFDAWEKTGVTEHEHMVVPAIYTPELVAALGADLDAAEAALRAMPDTARLAARYRERMRFTRAGFELLRNYVDMVTAGARNADYASAVSAGEKAVAAQGALRAINPLFTSGLVGGEEQGTSWLPGEVRQMASLRALTDGREGTLVARLPLHWQFKVERPLPNDWRYRGMEGPVPGRSELAVQDPTDANGWRAVRTDIYLQGQGILAKDGQSHLGHYWYRTAVQLPGGAASRKVRLRLPGLFNEAWLYVNGKLVGHRPYTEPWWQSDYRFEWDVDVGAHLRPGVNDIALRGFNPHHFGGLFRRTFLYTPVPSPKPGAATPE